MGQANSNITVIDPNQRQQSSTNNIEEMLKKTFQSAQTTNGRVYKDKFNEALSVLETMNIIRLRDTPVADRLFLLLDVNQNGYLDQNQYLQGIATLINDKEKRIVFSFNMMDKDGDKRVSKQEFYEFFKESWLCAFRLLGEKIMKGPNPYQLNLSKINAWSSSQLGDLHKKVSDLCHQLDPKQTGFLDFQYFRQWVISNDMSVVRAVLDGVQVEVPLHIYKLEVK